MKNIVCYFVEPAIYALDLAKNIYDKNRIDYCFINSNTLVEADKKSKKVFLDTLTFYNKLIFLVTEYKKNDFIIINGYNNYPFIITFLLNLFSFKNKFIAIESDTQLSLPKNMMKRLIKWLYLSIVFRNKYVLGFAGGSNAHKELFRYYGMNEKRIFLMPMMVDNAKFYQEEKSYPDVFTFLYVGRLVKHKGVEELIKQFNSKFSDKEAVLRIVGSGDQEAFLRDKYESEEVVFVGKKTNNDVVKELHAASCFVCPSLFEPWGLVVNEALSASLPVIATKEVGATFDLIKGKQTGLIAHDMNDFGDKMLIFYNNLDLLLQSSVRAQSIMREKWNYQLYDKCLNKAIKKVKKWH